MKEHSFCHISPTSVLDDLVKHRPNNLVLAHLVEHDVAYATFYKNSILWCNQHYGKVCILDNSAFELTQQGASLYPPEKLVEMGKRVQASHIVMSDYPGQHSAVTISSACALAPKFLQEGFGTFFVPQGEVGDIDDLLEAFKWAVGNVGKRIVDYIGVSILAAPNAYGLTKKDKLQVHLSRFDLMCKLHRLGILQQARTNGQKIHLLGMLHGPKEILLMRPFMKYIDTWDSSAAIWAGLNGVVFDDSPTGRLQGKFDIPVDFAYPRSTITAEHMELARNNMNYIDGLIYEAIQ